MVEYATHELIGIIFIALFFVFISFLCFSNKKIGFGFLFLLMSFCYLFLKLFDLSGLYPTELWILFNFYQGLVFFILVISLIRISILLKKHNGGY